MNDLYLTCETQNCARRAEPGRRRCVVCADRSEFFRLVPVRVPANLKTSISIIGAIVEAEAIIETMRQNVVRLSQGKAFKFHVGWWCMACKNYAKDLLRPCSCTTKIEDASSYFRFKVRNWRPCYADVG